MELFARSHNLLKALCNIKRLTLCIEFWTSDMMQSISNNIPTFPNLTHLGFYSYNYRWDILAMMLHSSPKLESLSLWKFMCICHASGNTSLETPQHVPRCVSVHLKEICFTRYEGKQIELEIARYILENATVLRKMTICWCSNLDAETRLSVTAKLSTFLRSSLTCKLIFS
ncbi:hypothetical protein L6164_000881 [Bauhinia variegata]|uniref:Uncharacterized protein n=1 Tax=Bauhinia variegata TaxID=167791 RepID=A0ACB9Q838_BAUVA|nr:hypothetical protein L6164_000881 [Bauhinia variegata]